MLCCMYALNCRCVLPERGYMASCHGIRVVGQVWWCAVAYETQPVSLAEAELHQHTKLLLHAACVYCCQVQL